MTVDDLVARWRTRPDADAIVWNDCVTRYGELEAETERQRPALRAQGIAAGATVVLEADFSPVAIAVLFALWLERAIVLPVVPEIAVRDERAGVHAAGDWRVKVGADESVTVTHVADDTHSSLFERLRAEEAPGLMVRTSGSEGRPKTIVHDMRRLLRFYETPASADRTLAVYIFDHIGGVHFILQVLTNGGCLVVPRGRTPELVAEAVARHRVELLSGSPTFMNLLVLSGVHERHDFGSVRTVSYGSEVMPDSTLDRVRAAWPRVDLVQGYGMSELGVLATRPRESDGRWLFIGDAATRWRIVDGLLEIFCNTAMLGYLDAPSPFTTDGWLRTGDAVDVDGEYLRILGRRSDMLNVGGEKVYPCEIETVLLSAPGVIEAVVCGEPSPIVGTMVKAVVRVAGDRPNDEERSRLRQFAQTRLLAYQVPQRLIVTREPLHGERLKARRRGDV